MIQSEQDRQFVLGLLNTWARNTKIKMFLRNGDLEGLTSSIMDRFYHVTLCCGHKVKELDEGISLEYNDNDGMISGDYCKDCAEKLLKDGARKIG